MMRSVLGLAALLAAATIAVCGPCNGGPFSSAVFCDPTMDLTLRVQDYIAHISLSDKLGQLGNGAPAMSSVDAPAYQWWSEALHGVANSPGVTFGGQFPYATSFPQVCSTSSSFNTTLFNAIGQTISTEARAFNNYGQAGLTFWAPNINIFRDPRWGRGQETPGEDPFLTSEYVTQFVQGMQNGEDPNHLKVSSCCKHYDAYSLENWGGVQRYSFNAIVSPQDFQDTYLPAFESCANRAQASGLMCSYNAVNGIPSCANSALLKDLLRDTWGYYGYITADCDAVSCVQYNHHYTNTTDETCQVVLQAGMDIDCGDFFTGNNALAQALDNGYVSLAEIDSALFDLYSVQFRLGMFDPPSSVPYTSLGPSDVNTPAAQQLAHEAAQQAVVLLKNKNNALPLSTANIKTVAVIGPNANATNTMQANYYGNAPYLISPVQGIQQYAEANFQYGCDMASTSTEGFAAAEQAAAAADATVLVIGLDQSQEQEGQDRTSLALPGVQSQLVAAVASAAKGPVIVVLMCGGAVDASAIVNNSLVDAILYVGYPGQSGGAGLADVIFGAYNPAGRLTQTWYTADYVNQVSMFDMGMRPNATSGNPGRGYRFYTGTPVFTFGQGLSYTTFTYQWSSVTQLSRNLLASHVRKYSVYPSRAPVLGSASVLVTNTGNMAGDDSVLLFVVPPNAGQDGTPIQYLAGFQRIHLTPGQSQTVTFDLSAMRFSIVDSEGKHSVPAGEWKLVVGEAEHVMHL